jgi:hypothetical protein
MAAKLSRNRATSNENTKQQQRLLMLGMLQIFVPVKCVEFAETFIYGHLVEGKKN